VTAAALPGEGAAPAVGASDGRVGPNAVIQLGQALRALEGEARALEVFEAADMPEWLSESPEDMVDERRVRQLFDALHARLPAERAAAAAADAGTRTADYLLANRIPRPVCLVLARLPAWASSRLLLRAITANAWTFAGSGAFTARAGTPHVVEIADNPIAMPGCTWHAAVFEGLFRALVSPRTVVRHVRCSLDGTPACRFEISHAGSARRAA
jgi:divinyl protochlorophyllide a 8-vinyl-reductase